MRVFKKLGKKSTPVKREPTSQASTREQKKQALIDFALAHPPQTMIKCQDRKGRMHFVTPQVAKWKKRIAGWKVFGPVRFSTERKEAAK